MAVEEKIGSIEFVKALQHRDKWLRLNGSDLGVDAGKFILGSALSDILWDNDNCFRWFSSEISRPTYINDELLFRQSAVIAQEEYIIRLKGGIATPELPEGIRGRLQKTLTIAVLADWTKYKHFSDAYDEQASVKEWVGKIKMNNPELDLAIAYSRGMRALVDILYVASPDNKFMPLA